VIHQVLSYIQWLPKTFYLHGIHSPFAYTLTKECLKNKLSSKHSKEIQDYRKHLFNSKKTIEVTDFGAGSRVFKSNTRKVSAIAKNAGATKKRMLLLQRLVAYLQPEQILEFGTSLGMATFAMSKGSQSSKITSLEGCPATTATARKALNRFNVQNVALIEGRFRESVKEIKPSIIDMVYFDGNHSKEATLSYVKMMLPTIHNDTVWIFDDIYWSPEMTQAWEKIKTMPEVSVTIDCYWLGLVFFRKEQAKEDFYARVG